MYVWYEVLMYLSDMCVYVCVYQLSSIADKVEGALTSPDELEFEQ